MLSHPHVDPGEFRPFAAGARPAVLPASTAIRASPCHRLADGALAGAELSQAGCAPPFDAVGQGWLLRAACQEASAWGADGHSSPALSVTLALPRQSVRSGTLLAQVEAALLGAGLSGPRLIVALPQASLADAGPDLLLLVSALRDLGARVALDGQAQAVGCERILRRLPVNAVRLHPDLVRRAEEDSDARADLSRVIRFAHAVDALAVGLGVSTVLQRDILADLRCDRAQGRLFGQDLLGSVFRAGLSKQAVLF